MDLVTHSAPQHPAWNRQDDYNKQGLVRDEHISQTRRLPTIIPSSRRDANFPPCRSAARPQDIGEHQAAVLRERQGWTRRVAMPLRTSRNLREVRRAPLSLGELKHEIWREARLAAADPSYNACLPSAVLVFSRHYRKKNQN